MSLTDWATVVSLGAAGAPLVSITYLIAMKTRMRTERSASRGIPAVKISIATILIVWAVTMVVTLVVAFFFR